MSAITFWKRAPIPQRPNTWPVFFVVATLVILIPVLFLVWLVAR